MKFEADVFIGVAEGKLVNFQHDLFLKYLL